MPHGPPAAHLAKASRASPPLANPRRPRTLSRSPLPPPPKSIGSSPFFLSIPLAPISLSFPCSSARRPQTACPLPLAPPSSHFLPLLLSATRGRIPIPVAMNPRRRTSHAATVARDSLSPSVLPSSPSLPAHGSRGLRPATSAAVAVHLLPPSSASGSRRRAKSLCPRPASPLVPQLRP